jgi:uncharacterized membrane protein YfcA
MNSWQVVGMEAVLAFFLALVTSSVIVKRKTRSWEGALVTGAMIIVCVLLGRPLMGQLAAAGMGERILGLIVGAGAGVVVFTGLQSGREYRAGIRNDLYDALTEINDDSEEAPRT